MGSNERLSFVSGLIATGDLYRRDDPLLSLFKAGTRMAGSNMTEANENATAKGLQASRNNVRVYACVLEVVCGRWVGALP